VEPRHVNRDTRPLHVSQDADEWYLDVAEKWHELLRLELRLEDLT
jgi:hypothetical protein